MPAPLLDFCSLQHIRIRKSTSRGVSTSRYVPPAGFGCPLGGLLLPNPRRPYFVPAALLGLHPSKRSPLERYPHAFPQRMNPRAVSLAGLHAACATSRSSEPRLPGFDPSESPSRPSVCLAHRPPAAPLGFRPFQGFPTRALARFRALSSHTLFSNNSRRWPFERRPRVSISPRFASTPSRRTSRRFWPRQPSEGFRAGPFLYIRGKILSGYVFTLCRAARYRRLAVTP